MNKEQLIRRVSTIYQARLSMTVAGLGQDTIDKWTVVQLCRFFNIPDPFNTTLQNKLHEVKRKNDPHVDWLFMAYNKNPDELI